MYIERLYFSFILLVCKDDLCILLIPLNSAEDGPEVTHINTSNNLYLLSRGLLSEANMKFMKFLSWRHIKRKNLKRCVCEKCKDHHSHLCSCEPVHFLLFLFLILLMSVIENRNDVLTMLCVFTEWCGFGVGVIQHWGEGEAAGCFSVTWCKRRGLGKYETGRRQI